MWLPRTFQGSTGYWLRVSWNAALVTSRPANPGIHPARPIAVQIDGTTNPSVDDDLLDGGVDIAVVTAITMNKDESGSVDTTRSDVNGGLDIGANFPTTKALFICARSEFNKWEVWLTGAEIPTNVTAATMTVEYWDGSAWTAVAGLSDGTRSGGISLRGSDDVTWTNSVHSISVKVNAIQRMIQKARAKISGAWRQG